MSEPTPRFAALVVAAPVEGVPQVSFQLDRWGEAQELEGELTLFECEFGEGAAEGHTEVATLSFKAARAPQVEELHDGPFLAPPPRFQLAEATLQTKAPLPEGERADFELLLGEQRFGIRVPSEGRNVFSEGAFFELGFRLEAAGEVYERLDPARVARVRVDALHEVLSLGVVHPVVKHVRLGRFADPARNPTIQPDQVGELARWTRQALERGGPRGVDADGLAFTLFVPASRRRAELQRLRDGVPLRPAGAFLERMGLGDIKKAYFVIHDVGIAGPVKADRYGADQERVSSSSVNGFLNYDGTYAPARDFERSGGGTKYEWLKFGRWSRPYVLGIECSPLVVRDDSAQDPSHSNGQGRYACVASNGEEGEQAQYWKWTHALLDTLADLYVYASARAGHLLTITTHLEMDRNLSLGAMFFAYSEAELREGKGKVHRHGAYLPRDSHGDPKGLDLQVLYDKITDRLNELIERLGGELRLPPGTRYGLCRERNLVLREDEALPRVAHNLDYHLHTFPQQSHPEPLVMTGPLRKRVAFWKAYSGEPKRIVRREVGGKVRRYAVGYKPGPWWWKDREEERYFKEQVFGLKGGPKHPYFEPDPGPGEEER